MIDDATGEIYGIMSAFDANRLAEEKGLDLVKVAPQAVPPVCKLMDYGKYKFDLSKKQKEARKNQHTADMKEMQLSMTIEQHDLETKAKHVGRFLAEGDKVKVSIRMKGRQQAHPEMGEDVMNRFFACVQDVGVVDKKPTREGRNILMILVPKKSKTVTEK
ncbi:translation initiation factor IF-3 [Clostridia bacterium]|nr:translation initiation factor IF-3 [Clostridia bacterium]